MAGSRLQLHRLGEERPFLSASLDELRRDRAGDGLTDRVEELLFLDPDSADTDGDGIDDSIDPAPNASPSSSSNENEEIVATILEQVMRIYGRVEGTKKRVRLVRTDASPEWRGLGGATIRIPPTPTGDGRSPCTGWARPARCAATR